MKDYTLKSGVQAMVNNRAPLGHQELGGVGIFLDSMQLYFGIQICFMKQSQTLKL